jgi:hypothetical protein
VKRRVVLKGGLGDILVALYSSDFFGTIDTLPAGDVIQVVILSPCRGIAELFERHPKRGQLEIVDLEYVDPMTPEVLAPYGDLPRMPDCHRIGQIVRYVSDADRRFIDSINGRFVAFSLSSSHDNRNVPDRIALEAAGICLESGLGVLLLGRNYEPWHRWGATRWMGRRSEPVVKAAGVMNGIDILTLPGALEAVSRSAGVFCSLSAFQLAAWIQGKKSCVVTSMEFAPVIAMIGGYKIGHLRYSNGHSSVQFAESWNADAFRSFVRSLPP